MYYKVETFLVIMCIIISILGLKGYMMYKKYRDDKEGSKQIIDYFEKNGSDGISPIDLPKEIIKKGYISWMVKDKILVVKNGKYYLNK